MTIFNVSSTAAFKTALTQAQSGDSILLAPGTYSGISIQNISKAGNVTITSQNLANPAVLEQFSMTNSSGLSFSHLGFTTVGTTDNDYVWRVTNCQNVSFDSLSVNGDPKFTPANSAAAFLISGCSNLSITNSSFNNLLTGIIESNSDHTSFIGNHFTQMGSDGIDSAQVSFVTIDNNTFTNFAPAPGAHPDAIQFWTEGTTASSHDITISGNTYVRGPYAASTDAQGVFMGNEIGIPYVNVSITNNTILGSMYNGIYLEDAQNSTINNNTVLGYSDMDSWIRVLSSNGVTLNGNNSQSYPFSSNTNVTQTNDKTSGAVSPTAPALANIGSGASYAAGDAAAAISQSISLSDTSSPVLTSASVAITGGFLAGDALNFTSQNGITGSYNAQTGVLTLSGLASTAAYQTALESVTFSSSAGDPTNGNADVSRTIGFSVNDGIANSNSLNAHLAITPPPATADLDAASATRGIAYLLSVADPSSTALTSATVSIADGFMAGDSLNFTNQNGITGSYNSSTGVLTLSGSASAAAYQAALATVTLTSSATDPTQGGTDGSRAVSFSVSNGQGSSGASVGLQYVFSDNAPAVVHALAAAASPHVASAAAASAASAGSVAKAPAPAVGADIMHTLALMGSHIIGGAGLLSGSDSFIFKPSAATSQPGLRVGAMASGTPAPHVDLTGLGHLSAFDSPAAPVAPHANSHAAVFVDTLTPHQADFMVQLIGVHTQPSPHLLFS